MGEGQEYGYSWRYYHVNPTPAPNLSKEAEDIIVDLLMDCTDLNMAIETIQKRVWKEREEEGTARRIENERKHGYTDEEIDVILANIKENPMLEKMVLTEDN